MSTKRTKRTKPPAPRQDAIRREDEARTAVLVILERRIFDPAMTLVEFRRYVEAATAYHLKQLPSQYRGRAGVMYSVDRWMVNKVWTD